MMTGQTIVPVESITDLIFTIRDKRIILDADLSRLYGLSTKQLNQAVKRNPDRFPEDFVFRLTVEEYDNLMNREDMRSQIVTASKRNIRYLPYAFTEYGTVMAASVLNSPKQLR